MTRGSVLFYLWGRRVSYSRKRRPRSVKEASLPVSAAACLLSITSFSSVTIFILGTVLLFLSGSGGTKGKTRFVLLFTRLLGWPRFFRLDAVCVLAETSLFFGELSRSAVSWACEHGCLRPWFLWVHETLLGRGYNKFWVPLSASTLHQEYFSLKGKCIIGREGTDYGPCCTVYVFFSGRFHYLCL